MPANYPDQQNLSDQLALWYDIGGPLFDAFRQYQICLSASQGAAPVNKALWFGYAAIDPRFLDIGTAYGVAPWTVPGSQGNGVPGFQLGNEALWKTRARLLSGLDPNAAPPDTVWNTMGRVTTTTLMTPQEGVFTSTVYVIPNQDVTGAKCTLGMSKSGVSGNGPQVLFNGSGMIQAQNGAVNVGAVPYALGAGYTFRLVVDVPNHVYSAYVTPDGGAEQTLGENLAFHPSHAGVNQLKGTTSWASATSSGTASRSRSSSSPSVPRGWGRAAGSISRWPICAAPAAWTSSRRAMCAPDNA